MSGFGPIGDLPIASLPSGTVVTDDNNVTAGAPTLLTFQGFLPTIVELPGLQVERYGFVIAVRPDTTTLQVERYGFYIAGKPGPPFQVNQFGFYVTASQIPVLEVAAYSLYIVGSSIPTLEVVQYGMYIVGRITPLVIPALASISPETPILESWRWISDQMVSEDGTEQRVSLRGEPKRYTSMKYIFIENDDLKEAKRQLYDDFRDNEVAIPLYQYGAVLKAAANAGASALLFNEARTDLRVDGWVLIIEGSTYELRIVDTLSGTGCTLTEPLVNSYTQRAKVMPVALGIIDNGSALIQYPKNGPGSLTLKGSERLPVVPFIRESATVELDEFNGLPVLERRATGADFSDQFDNGRRTVDYGGNIDTVVPWRFTHFGGDREYICQRLFEPLDWDYWKAFAYYCKGSVNPFYLPTFRDDFNVLADADALGDQFTVEGQVYSTTYFANPVFQQIRISAEAGIHYATITGTIADGDDEILTFDPPLPDGAGWEVDQEICLLLRARLGSDEIALEHHSGFTSIKLSTRTIDV